MKSFELEYYYDYNYDLMDMSVKENFNVKQSVELDKGIIIDFDENDVPVSLDMINPSKTFGIDKRSLISPSIKICIKVSHDLIKLQIKCTYNFHHKEHNLLIEENVLNKSHISSKNTVLQTA